MLRRSEDNYVHFSKPFGRATVVITKEGWWQRARKERQQGLRWELSFTSADAWRDGAPPAYTESPAKYSVGSVPEKIAMRSGLERCDTGDSHEDMGSPTLERAFEDIKVHEVAVEAEFASIEHSAAVLS